MEDSLAWPAQRRQGSVAVDFIDVMTVSDQHGARESFRRGKALPLAEILDDAAEAARVDSSVTERDEHADRDQVSERVQAWLRGTRSRCGNQDPAVPPVHERLGGHASDLRRHDCWKGSVGTHAELRTSIR